MEKISLYVISPTALARIIMGNLFMRDNEVKVLGASRPDAGSFKKLSNLKPDVLAIDLDPQFTEWPGYVAEIDPETFSRMILFVHGERGIPAGLESFKDRMVILDRPAKLEGEDVKEFRENFLQSVTRCKQIRPSTPNVQVTPSVSSPVAEKLPFVKKPEKLVCIGTSTGGPKALQSVLESIPANIPAPIAIVQHMPPNFTKSLANRLDSVCKIRVKEAEDGELLRKGTAYIAPGGRHLFLEESPSGLKAKIGETPPVNGHRPSVDVLFTSAAKLSRYEVVSVIMTGMGADGAKGLALLKEEPWVRAIAESEETCIVYGMPKAAVQTGKVDVVAKLGDIAGEIMKFLK